jgi:hypothetical protein
MNPYPVGQIGRRLVFDVGTFNEAAATVQNAAGLRGGRGVLVSRLSDRVIVNIDRQAGPVHPWHTSVEWHEDKEEWRVRVVPGFVNGMAPDVPALTYDETGKTGAKVSVTPTLLEDWAFPIPKTGYREVRGRELGEAVPRYFQDMGVKEEKHGMSTGGGMGVTVNMSEQETEGDRLLRAVDVVLTAFRWTYKLDVTFPGNLVLGQIVDYSVTLDAAQAFRRPTISVMPRIPAAESDDAFMQRLMGNFGDEGFDQILVSTVYFVSPPKSAAKKPLDQVTDEWTPVAKHNLFWNLGYWSEVEPPRNFQQLSHAGLYAFVGRYTVAPAATAGAMEAMFQQILTAAFNKKPSGVFYTT